MKKWELAYILTKRRQTQFTISELHKQSKPALERMVGPITAREYRDIQDANRRIHEYPGDIEFHRRYYGLPNQGDKSWLKSLLIDRPIIHQPKLDTDQRNVISYAAHVMISGAGVGKTTVLVEWAERLCRDGEEVLVISNRRNVRMEARLPTKAKSATFPELACSSYTYPGWIFVDEAQEITQANMDIIQRITRPNVTEVVYIGDPNQSAPNSIFANMVLSLHPMYLLTNYRSAASIVQALNQFGERYFNDYVCQVPAREREGEVLVLRAPNPNAAVARFVAEKPLGATFVFSLDPSGVRIACSQIGNQIRMPSKMMSADENYVVLPTQTRGTERPQVIIVGEWDSRDMYVAMSRAEDRLIIINPSQEVGELFGVQNVDDIPQIAPVELPVIDEYVVAFDIEGRGDTAKEVGAVAYLNGAIIDRYEYRRPRQTRIVEWGAFQAWREKHAAAKWIRWAGSEDQFLRGQTTDVRKMYKIHQQRLGVVKPPSELIDAAEIYAPHLEWTPHVAIDDARVTLEVYLRLC